MKTVFILIFIGIPLFLNALDIHRGDKGIVITEFEEGNLDSINFIVKNVVQDNGSGYPSILVLFSDSIMNRYGVASGMSGSPAYIKGKLIGALSSTWPFLNQPLGNLTPIEEMYKLKKSKSSGNTIKSSKIHFSYSTHSFLMFADSILKKKSLSVESASYSDSIYPVSPGHTIGIGLISGDMVAAIVGTITKRNGNEIYALGHPALGLGRCELPMMSCKTITTADSRYMSFKIPEVGKIIGTVINDGYSGIYGILGKECPIIPTTIEINGKRYSYMLASSKYISPMLFQLAAFHATSKSFLSADKNSFRMKFEIRGKDFHIISHMYGKRKFAPYNIINYISSLMSLLYGNEIKPLEIRKINLSINTINRDVFRSIKKIDIVPKISKNDKKFNIMGILSKYQGCDSSFVIKLSYKRLKSGNYTLVLMGRKAYIDFIEKYKIIDENNIDDIIATLNTNPKKPFIYYAILNSSKGLIIDNKYFNPPSLANNILTKERSIKYVKQLVYIDSIPVDFILEGKALTSFVVEAK